MSSVQEAAERAIRERSLLIEWCQKQEAVVALASGAQREVIKTIALVLASSKLVIWEHDICELALSGHASFHGLSSKPLFKSTEAEYWSYKDFDLLDNSFEPGSGLEIGATLFVPPLNNAVSTSTGFTAFVLFPGEGTGRPPTFHVNKFNPIISAKGQEGQIIACHAFMQLKLAAIEKVLLPRSTRRRMERLGQTTPDVRIVQLRQRESSGTHTEPHEYHHKWIVKGHWRRLHEPRKKDGAEVTFVHAYVKGPEGAPLLQPRESVYVVAR